MLIPERQNTVTYKITIEETHAEVQTRGHDWMLLGKQSDAVYGYTPEIEKHVTVTTKIYEQVVAELDIIGVISAINVPSGVTYMDRVVPISGD